MLAGNSFLLGLTFCRSATYLWLLIDHIHLDAFFEQ